MRIKMLAGAAVLIAITASCMPTRPTVGEERTNTQAAPSGQTLVVAVRDEPKTLAGRLLQPVGGSLWLARRMFNAHLAVLNEQGTPLPYLAEALPHLGTDSWKVFADGRMETIYRLKPGLSWHDGVGLSAQDFVFSWQVYSDPEIAAVSAPINLIDEAAAPDERTLLIRWKRPYLDAGSLRVSRGELPPLPRHLLEPTFLARQADAIVNHEYWTSAYVGLGPYRLEGWVPGAFLTATAFESDALGAPQIKRIKMTFMPDGNSVLASMLAGETHLAADTALPVAQVPVVLRQWGPGGGGAVLFPSSWRSVNFQFRPEYLKQQALFDPRVRKALAHAVDRDAINETVYESLAVVADTMISPISEVGPAVSASISRYALDLRRSEELMREAGFIRGGDGIYQSAIGPRLDAELKTNASPDNEAEMHVLASAWRGAGFDIREAVLPTAQTQDNEVRSTFSDMYSNNTGAGEPAISNFTSAAIARPDNRWQGGNRGGWSNPEYDRLVGAITTTLDRAERGRYFADATKIISGEMPAISLFFLATPWVFAARLRGLRDAAPESDVTWNIHEWEFR